MVEIDETVTIAWAPLDDIGALIFVAHPTNCVSPSACIAFMGLDRPHTFDCRPEMLGMIRRHREAPTFCHDGMDY